MITIKNSTKKDITNQVIVVSNLDQLNKILSKKEKEYIATKLKKNFETVKLERLGETVFVLKIVDKLNNADKEKIRQKGVSFQKEFTTKKEKEVVIINASESHNASLLVAEGMALSNYQFLKYFKDAKQKANSLKTIYIQSDKVTKKEVEELNILLEATYWARDLVNEPVSFLNATELSNQIVEMGEKANIKVEVLDQMKLETLKMGGLLAVNQGSVDPATFTIMEWKPAKAKNKKPIVFVGKGVVYDTGGLSLKPTAHSMDVMKCDMGGAAAVACAIYAIAKAKLPVHVIGLVPATDNRPGGNAYAPGDVVTMFDGTTVEVLNTDAEGRMLLADALSYAKKYKPELVFDAATLTGSAMRAIGDYGTVVVGNAGDATFKKVEESGYSQHERVARLPFWDDYAEEIKSSIADINNLGGPNAGAITAGKFLEHFTDYPWIHFDIAAPAWMDKEKGYLSQGGTGVGVKLFYDFIKNY